MKHKYRKDIFRFKIHNWVFPCISRERKCPGLAPISSFFWVSQLLTPQPHLPAAAGAFKLLNLLQLQFYELCRESACCASNQSGIRVSCLSRLASRILTPPPQLKEGQYPAMSHGTVMFSPPLISSPCQFFFFFTRAVHCPGLASDGFISLGSSFLFSASLISHFRSRCCHCASRGKQHRHF